MNEHGDERSASERLRSNTGGMGQNLRALWKRYAWQLNLEIEQGTSREFATDSRNRARFFAPKGTDDIRPNKSR